MKKQRSNRRPKTNRTQPAAKHRQRAAVCLRLLPASLVLAAAPLPAGQLPVVCVAGSCGASAPASWLGSGQATATYVGNTLNVQQTSEQAILNWASFNVSRDGSVIFHQPNASAIALNQIFQASPSQIFGLVKANGQIYLVNQNGFVFGSTAQVNVGGLLASTLQLTDPLASGLLAPVQNRLPALSNPLLGPDGNPVPVQIGIQPGALLSTNAAGERIFLASGSVINDGTISAPDGQVILAAGQSVFVQASNNPNLRGLIVEVDSGGLAENLAQGSISVAEGNATLVGLAVNQQGRISATTSVSQNGSIELLARDTVAVQPNQEGVLQLNPANGGTLTLGPTSVTEVLPDTTSTATAIDAQAQPQSQITLAGKQIDLTGGSNIIAPGGAVSITASSDPSAPNSSLTPDPSAHLRIDTGAMIDVAGSTASVPVTRNLVSVTLRGSELADDPLQRNGPLRGETVVIDARVGTPLANVSGDLALIQRGILERTSTGGSITLDSGGDVVVASGATLNVSGGAVDYTPGIMQTSLLLKPDGTTVDIGSASPNQVYAGVINPTFKSVSSNFGIIQFIPTPGIAHDDPGYVQGASAGSINILGSSLVLDGTFLGHATNGIYQRSGAGVAAGGTFSIGLESAANPALPDYRAPAVEFVNQAPTVVVDPEASLPSDLPLELPVSFIASGGFNHIAISSNDRISVAAGVPIDLAPGGSLSFQAPAIDVDSSIKVPGGTIQLTSTQSFNTVYGSPGLGIFVGNGVTFDVSGMWTNDSLLANNLTPTGFAYTNAGSIALDQQVFAATLSLGNDVSLLASGGVDLARGGGVTGGTGGSIALIGSPGGTVQVGAADALSGFGVQGALGGSFSLEVPRLQIGSGASTWLGPQSVDSDPNSLAFFKIDASLFSNFGFSSFTLTADGPREAAAMSAVAGSTTDTLTLMPGSAINLQTRTLMLDPGAERAPTGSSLSEFVTSTLLPLYERNPSRLALLAAPGQITPSEIGDLTIGANATISADPGSTFLFASVGNLNFNGALTSPSSSVTLENLAPPAGLSPGYVPTLAIELGPTASIDVAGSVIYKPTDTGLLEGNVLAGGSVTLSAAYGSVVTNAGSLIDFSGSQAPLDLVNPLSGATQLETVASAAGSLSIEAPETISLLGAYRGAPGVGTTGRAAGGALDLSLVRPVTPVAGFPSGPVTLTVQPGPLTAALPLGSGTAVLSTEQLRASGVDALTLESSSEVQFTNGAQLNLGRSFTLLAPAIDVESQGAIGVSAPYLALGAASSGAAPIAAAPGAGTINFSGSEVDLVGGLSFLGVGHANITSSGEILLEGELLDAKNLGSVSIAGELTLRSARVVPTTDVNFTISAAGGANNTVQFEQDGTLPGVPLSVGGSLTVNADNIVQGGTVFAPFGELSFAANQTLAFAPGSLTSVSGTSSILPYGEVQNGTTWVYQVSSSQVVPVTITGIPNRQVSASGAKVTLQAGATVDVSGGGDLSAWEFTPGPGGTTDVLANTVTPGLYAILPSLAGQSAPYDPMMWAGSNLTPNESVYLSGGGGLAAGVYPLLPARYALLPGAFLISVASGFQDLVPGSSVLAANGFPIVSGHLTFGNTGIGDTRTSGFLIEPGSYASQLADYTNNAASTFFAAAAASAAAAGDSTAPVIPSSVQPADAGTLVVSVQSQFDALGKVKGAAGPGGEGATIEISAPSIEVDPTADANVAAGQTHLSASVLDSWNAGRLWLGGQSEPDGSFNVAASSVVLGAGSRLSADEVMLAATGEVQVDSGAAITTTAPGSTPPAAASAMPTALTLGGSSSSSALLIASDLTYWQPQRTGAAPGTEGTVIVAPGAEVSTRGALTIDAPGGGTLADGTLSGSGAQWSVGATNLAFAAQGTVSNGFSLDQSLIAAMGLAHTVRLASANAIGVDQSVSLGGSSVSEIDFAAPGITNDAGTGAASFAAALITLTGTAAAAPTVQSGAGTLSLTAREIDLDSGNFALQGYATSTVDAANAIVGMGVGQIAAAGNLNLLAPALTADSGAQTQVSAAGALSLGASSHASTGAAVLQTGGSLALAGNTVVDDTLISMPSGEVSISATQQLSLGSRAGIDVGGVLPANAAHGSDGGTIDLRAGTNVTAASGSSLSVAAAAGANAGSISIEAGGGVALGAELDGSSAAGLRTGSFSLTAGSLANFSALNAALEHGGFHATRAIEVASGDLDLAAGSTISASNVVLTADTGAITVGGSIDASGTGGGGTIALSAHNDVTLGATANLSASGTSSSAGGLIEIASTAGAVVLDPASQIAALGANGSGTLLVRAPELASGTDAAISSLPANLARIGSVVLEPIMSSALGAVPTAADFQAIESTLASTMTASGSNIVTRLGVAGDANVVLRPYADITTSGDLTLSSIDFSTWRFNGQPADISIRAGGTLTVTGSVSDGFSSANGFLDVQSSGDSARISLVAGANFSSASATSVVAGAQADLDLGAGAIVRTGTGALELTAARDISFGSGASVYTGGIQGAPSNANTDTGAPVSFATQGGNILISAGRDVLGAPLTEAVDMWNPRFQPNTAAIWGIDFGAFEWNVGALGGGNVVINAGRNAIDLTAAVADSRTFAPDGVTSIALGGGNLTVNTGGDVGSGLFYVGNGVGRIDAGGALSSTLSDGSGNALGTMLLAGDASYDVSAERNVLLQGMISETALAPGSNSDLVYFFRYDPGSILSVQSRGGSVTYESKPEAQFLDINGAYQSDANVFTAAPPSLDFASFASDVIFATGVQAMPSTHGELTIYAARDILSNPKGQIVGMSDEALSLVATADAPSDLNGVAPAFDAVSYTGASLHQDDPVAVLISAGRDISGIGFELPKYADISAGRNIVSLNFAGQNLNPGDITTIRAGGNISYASTDAGQSLTLTGPGQFDLIAGGNIDLGFTQGIATYGNILNANMASSTGASITVLAGLGAPIGVGGAAAPDDFVGKIVAGTTAYQNMLIDYVEQQSGKTNLTFAAAAPLFRDLPLTLQLPLIEDVFFAELVLSGQEANQVPSPGFTRGYDAIDGLFPGSRTGASPYSGNLSLGFSRIYTLDGGSISLLVPGGGIDVGLANPPASFAEYGINRVPSQLGIVAVGSGDVDIYTYDSILVNQSRVFTLGGGNISIWSTTGNIDAGNGAKTSISAPPPTVSVDANGNVTLDFSAAIAGSGIRTIQSLPGVAAGDVNLIAPVGFVNAGDAGIGSAGNINIAAQRVIGVTNINFGGTATGVPPEVSGLGVSLASASSVASSATSAASSTVEASSQATTAAPLAAAALGWLDVFVEGFGEEVCKPNDIDCLKRNHK